MQRLPWPPSALRNGAVPDVRVPHGVAPGAAAEVGGSVCGVQRCACLQACDEVGVGQGHLTIGLQISQARGHVLAEVFACSLWPVQDQCLVPELAQIRQQRFVAVVHDVQVGQAELVEFAHEIPVEVRAFIAMVQAHAGEARGKPDARAVGADLGDDSLRDLDGEARTVLQCAAVPVGPPVRAQSQKLVDQVGHAMDFHTVTAGIDGPPSRVAVLVDGRGNLLGQKRARHRNVLHACQREDLLAGRDR